MSAIQSYVDTLRSQNARAAAYLRPGNPGAIDQLQQTLLDLSPPESLSELWDCFDGVDHTKRPTLDEVWLDGAFYFFSVAEAIDDYRACEPLWKRDPTFDSYWPKRFLPVATPGDGSRLLVDCRPKRKTNGSVHELFHGAGVTRSAASIQKYFETMQAWLDEGAVAVDADGCLSRDFLKASEIARRRNPGCNSWGKA